jgi:hypothetical protein
VEVGTDTVARVRQRFIERRPGAALACSRTAKDFAEVLRWLVEKVQLETE